MRSRQLLYWAPGCSLLASALPSPSCPLASVLIPLVFSLPFCLSCSRLPLAFHSSGGFPLPGAPLSPVISEGCYLLAGDFIHPANAPPPHPHTVQQPSGCAPWSGQCLGSSDDQTSGRLPVRAGHMLKRLTGSLAQEWWPCPPHLPGSGSRVQTRPGAAAPACISLSRLSPAHTHSGSPSTLNAGTVICSGHCSIPRMAAVPRSN